MSVLSALADALRDARVEVIDLTAPLSAATPVIKLPEPFGNTATFGLHEISRYDGRADPGFLLEVDHVRTWEGSHGPLPEGGWLLYRTGWDARSDDQDRFLNASETGPHTPGVSVECARWLAEEAPVIGMVERPS